MFDFSCTARSIHTSTYIRTIAFSFKHSMITTGTPRVNNILSNHKINESINNTRFSNAVYLWIYFNSLLFRFCSALKMISLRYCFFFFYNRPQHLFCLQIYIYIAYKFVLLLFHFFYSNLFTSKWLCRPSRVAAVSVHVIHNTYTHARYNIYILFYKQIKMK